ncbi:interphotoreceptor matrix proteoglycan 2 [Pholidichthys leucotaenia]
MTIISWRCVWYALVFSWVVIFLDTKTDATLEGSSMGYLGLPEAQEPVAFPPTTAVSEVKQSHEGHVVISRQKRNILFPSGVKLCAQETVEQVVANHLSYFHLRVCQETIWEAFKIFWDRLPAQEEYQNWMSKCQEGTVSAGDIGSYFSQSAEHQTLAKKRMSHQGLKSEPTRSWQHMCSSPTSETPKSVEAPDVEDTPHPGEDVKEAAAVITEAEESSLYNDITVQPPTPAPLEQVVSLSILLSGEMFSADLADPGSLQFQMLSRQLAEKIEDALQGLPGFKSVSVTDFRPGGIVVDYAVTVVVNGAGVSSEQMNYLTLQSNLVESSYHENDELPTLVSSTGEETNVFTETLPSDELKRGSTVSEIPDSVNTADGIVVSAVDEPPEVLEEDIRDDILPEPSETNTVATADSNVVVLEESEVGHPAVVLTTHSPETGSIEEEGLLLEDGVQTSSSDAASPKEVPVELPESITLPEPPVETEASGSGPDDVEALHTETTPEEKEKSPAEVASEGKPMTEEIKINTDAVSDAEGNNFEVTAMGEAPTPMVEDGLEDELIVSKGEIADEFEISTMTTETIEEEGLPPQIPIPDAVDIANEVSEAAATDLLPVGDSTAERTPEEPNLTNIPANDEVNPKMPEEEPTVNVVLTHPKEPAFEGDGIEAIESVGIKVQEDAVPEANPEMSAEDLTEDEIVLVNKDSPGHVVTASLSPPQPTSLSPERESPFTRISDVSPTSDDLPETEIPALVEEIQTSNEGLDTGDHSHDIIQYGYGQTNHTEEGSTGFPFGVSHGTDQASIAMPVNPGRALMVFFSLRVTNMIFSEDLFNKSSPEYKALEQRFLELLVPYLQSNLSHFENLEILNFRNGSIVVNSRMKFGRPVARGVTTTVYLILEDFCNTAYQTMNLAIDKYSLDVESGDQADPCKFQACNEYAECKVNKWSGEAECVCNAGYFSVDGLPCQSICELQTDFCLNDGKCDIIPGQGAICRCRVGENWWYRGEHCEEYVSEPLVVGIAIASVAGFLLVASGVIFFLARTLRDQYDKEESEDPIRHAESLPSLERATKYNPMYESEATTGYSHYYRRYPEPPVYSSASAEASTDFSSEEIRHIYENSELTKEEIQDRIRIIELYAKDRQFADFVRQHQAVLDTHRENSSTEI